MPEIKVCVTLSQGLYVFVDHEVCPMMPKSSVSTYILIDEFHSFTLVFSAGLIFPMLKKKFIFSKHPVNGLTVHPVRNWIVRNRHVLFEKVS